MLLTLVRVFLLFLSYSFLGWGMETIWCSAHEKRFVRRGFLYGPICPIYGVGALLITHVLSYFTWNFALFYIMAVVIMSAWEYLVGWFLEVTTGIKYWDYSNYRFNLKGRICLNISVCWGVLALVFIYVLDPWMNSLLDLLSQTAQLILAIVLAVGTLVDLVFTIRSLALMTVFVRKLNAVSEELRDRIPSSSEVREYVEGKLSAGSDAVSELRDKIPSRAEVADELRVRRDDLLAKAEKYSRRWAHNYPHISSPRYKSSMEDIRGLRQKLKDKLDAARTEH